ncbi:50S ribosomal protein L17 [Orenia metallireducens]|uniref:Large ribosomal subunit protein bL17 n=1 Tax=Orenia metallireducens TaxID=1413210 RepID=A0A1C0ABQ7_9FIRM|nr:50S ribosomal protein L17 [Orenia metallireducens]OCL27812.1 50S ribosomal protein L17 [Orenia metallireducens]
MAQRKLGRKSAPRKALFIGLANALFKNERIETTEAKAKEVRRIAEKLITKAKKGTQHDRRQVMSTLQDKDTVQVLFDEIAPRFAERQGGYTRILKVGPRRGDSAPMAILELVE